MKFTWFLVLAGCVALSACSARGATGTAPIGSNLAFAIATDNVPVIGGCRIFPRKDPWNTDISNSPVDPHSADYLANMNPSAHLHPDFGSNPTYGIPYVVVPGSQPFVPMSFQYANESDPGPYPFPPNAPVESGSDRHVLVIDSGNCHLYETFASQYVGPGWHAGSGAIFDFGSDGLRPDGWTSADAAGLPIFAGLVRYYEVQAGAIDHALRFTVHATQDAFVHPATHQAGSSDAALPPMGLRVRLKANYDISHFTGDAKVILTALKRYGMLGEERTISKTTGPRGVGLTTPIELDPTGASVTPGNAVERARGLESSLQQQTEKMGGQIDSQTK